MEEGGTGIWLVFSVTTIFRHPLIQELTQQAAPGEPVVVTDATGTPALALIPPARGPEMLAKLATGRPLEEAIGLANTTQRQITSSRLLRCLSAGTSVARTEYDFLRALENPRDGFFDTYLNRYLSCPITRWFVHTPLSPNQITLLSFLTGLLGAVCFFPGGYWWPLFGAVLLQFAAVLDCCDGEVARAKFMESKNGYWLDVVSDTVVHIALFIGIGVAVWRNSGASEVLAITGVLALGGILAFPLVTLAEETKEVGERRGGWEDAWIQGLLKLATRDFSVVVLVSAVVGKLSWFLWGAAIGVHVFWLSLAWLLFRAGRFRWIRHVWDKQ
jgi:phosphatidylglycerophosphate synthase